jgi:enoyl-CoA hydratase/carnithine racemase
MAEAGPVSVSRHGRVALVRIDRPAVRNALDEQTMEAIASALEAADRDESVGAVVLTGSDRVFAAGADIKVMVERDAVDVMVGGQAERWRRIRQVLVPIVAAVNGFALGGGCELALACDLRYASRTAKLGQPESNLAIIPGWGGTQRLARVCGLGVAKDLILTGRIVDAEEALRIGLVSALYEPGELMERVSETARALAAKGPVALAAAKAAVNHALQGDHVENLTAEAKRFGDLFATEDQKEGMTAFVEKREPQYRGR